MTYIMTSAQFAGKIKSIKSTTEKMRADVQAALIGATYLCLKNSGGTTPFQQILDAVGNAAHRKGITTWMETYAPVIMKNDKVLLNKTMWKELNVEALVEGFDDHVRETGMDDVKWYVIAAEQNTTESIFDGEARVESLCKKLEKNGLPAMAQAIRQAVDGYKTATTAAIKAELENAGLVEAQ